MDKYREDPDLYSVLEKGEGEDLDVLAGIITDNGKGRLTLENRVLSLLERARATKDFSPETLKTIAAEIQLYGGHTLSNLVGGQGKTYAEVARDVARHVGADISGLQGVEKFERAILARLFETVWEKSSPAQRVELGGALRVIGEGPALLAAAIAAIRAGGFTSYQWALIAANAVTRTLLGRGLSIAGNAALTRTMGALAGPLGWLVMAIWTAYDLGSPGYRVTVPAVIHIAQMRMKQMSPEAVPA